MKGTKRTQITRIIAIALMAALAVGVAPAMASALGDARTGGSAALFSTVLAAVEAPVTAAEKVGTGAEDAAAYTRMARRPARTQAPLPRPVTTWTRTATTSGTSKAAAAATVAQNATLPTPPAQPAASTSDGLAEARAILARYAATYKHVSGTTVEFGNTQGNPQAIVYYKSKRIIINANHTVSLERIIAHEIWHIIDWHDNGAINWGESVPPSNANDYRL